MSLLIRYFRGFLKKFVYKKKIEIKIESLIDGIFFSGKLFNLFQSFGIVLFGEGLLLELLTKFNN